MFLMDVHVSAKFNLTVFVVVNFKAWQDGPQDHGVLFLIRGQEIVKPKCHIVYHFDDEAIGVLLKRQLTGNCA